MSKKVLSIVLVFFFLCVAVNALALTRSDWEFNDGEGIVSFTGVPLVHGDQVEFDDAVIPPLDDPNWAMLPGPEYINYQMIRSSLCDLDVEFQCMVAGQFTYFKTEGGYNMAGGNLFRSYVSAGYGGFFDGTRIEAGFTSVWNVSRHLELIFQYNLNRVRFSNRNQRFDAHIARFRIQGALNRHFSIQAFVQYNSIADIIVSNIRMRYNFSEGHDLWLVYNEGLNTDRDQYEIIPPRSSDRTILAKYVVTFGF